MTVAPCTECCTTHGTTVIAGTAAAGYAPAGNILAFPRRIAKGRAPAARPILSRDPAPDLVDLVKAPGFLDRLHDALGLSGQPSVPQSRAPRLRLVAPEAA